MQWVGVAFLHMGQVKISSQVYLKLMQEVIIPKEKRLIDDDFILYLFKFKFKLNKVKFKIIKVKFRIKKFLHRNLINFF